MRLKTEVVLTNKLNIPGNSYPGNANYNKALASGWIPFLQIPEQGVIDALKQTNQATINGVRWKKDRNHTYWYWKDNAQPEQKQPSQEQPEAQQRAKTFVKWKPVGLALQVAKDAGVNDNNAIIVLLEMAAVAVYNAQFKGACFTGSIESIALMARMSRAPAQRALSVLIDAGLLKVVKKGRAGVTGRTFLLPFLLEE